MQPKRFLISLLAVILICLTAGITVSAEETSPLKLAVSVSSETAVSTEPVTVQAGDTLEVSVTVAENPGVAILEFNLVYDPAVVSVKTEGGNVAYTKGDFFPSNTNTVVYKTSEGVINVRYIGTKNATAENTAIITFQFTVNGCAVETLGATAFDLQVAPYSVANEKYAYVDVAVDEASGAFYAHDKLEKEAVAESPCVTPGYTCPTCEAVAVQGTVNHVVEDVAEVPADCVTDGRTAGRACKNCDYVESGCEVIEALGHDLKDVAAKSVTCLEDGWNAHKACQREGCDFTEGKEVITAKGEHTPEVIPATKDKTEGSRCSVCGEILKAQEDVPANLLWLWILIAVVVLAGAGVAVYFFVFKKQAKTKHIGRPGSQK